MLGVSSVANTDSRASTSTDTIQHSATLDQDAFLHLLTIQLQYQDPLKPLEDREFIAQMAQFSSLEQMQQMNSRLDLVSTQLHETSLLGLIGHTVVTQQPGATTQITGTVEAIRYVDGWPQLQVNGATVDPSWVISVQ